MKIIERIVRGLYLFLFGLTIGGVGMWFATLKTLKETSHTNRANRKISYRDYYTG